MRPQLLALMLLPVTVTAQDLADAAEEVRLEWIEHRVADLAPGPDQVALRLPDADLGLPLDPPQAAAILREFLGGDREVDFVFRSVRQLDQASGFADAVRTYVPRGTTSQMNQRVFLGFRLVAGEWRLREIRVNHMD